MRNLPWVLLLLVLLMEAVAPLRSAGAGSAAGPSRLGGFLERLSAAEARNGDAAARALAVMRGVPVREEGGALWVTVLVEPRSGLPGFDLARRGLGARGARIDAAS